MKNNFYCGLILIIIFVTGCSGNEKINDIEENEVIRPTILFADAGWESLGIHNEIAKIILNHGYGYNAQSITAPSSVLRDGLKTNEIDVFMEIWVYDSDFYEEIEKGIMVSAGTNFKGIEGIYVPRYMIYGDESRGIKATLPNLKSVTDLKEYYWAFKTKEEDDKGNFNGAVKGWVAESIVEEKLSGYGLKPFFNNNVSENAWGYDLAIIKAYEAGEPWVGYFWEPTSIIGSYDLVKLEEAPYDKKIWESTKLCDFPNNDVEIVVSNQFHENNPEAFEFLEKYYTGTKINNEMLSKMSENKWTPRETAIWFLKNHNEIWKTWVSKDISDKIIKELNLLD